METYDKFPSIKYWAESERPREKMLNLSKEALTDSELLAILLGSGSRNQSAVDLAKMILASVNNNLLELSKLSIKDLMKFNGVGDAKAITIVAALELGNRKRSSEVLQRAVIRSSKDVFDYFNPKMADLQHEEFWIMTINRANRIKRTYCVSEGGVAGTVVDPRRIFKLAIEDQASGIVLCHNHPSGNLNPSEEDRKITRKLKEAGLVLDIPVLDHVIVCETKYFSFVDNGIL